MRVENRHNLPDRVIRQISLPYQPKPNRLGVTRLIDSPLVNTLWLEKWDEIVVDYSDFLIQLFGISMHDRQESLAADDEQAEHKMEEIVNGITVVGKSDTMDNGIIRDTKVSKVGYLKYHKYELECQLNCYAWLWSKEPKAVIKSLEGDLYYRDWDWKRVEFQDGLDYPEILWENVKVDLWTPEQQEEYIKNRVKYHKERSHAECTPEEKWTQPSKFAVMKSGKTEGRSIRNLNSWQEAKQYIQQKNLKNVEIVERKGGTLRCNYFCSLGKCGVCPYFSK